MKKTLTKIVMTAFRGLIYGTAVQIFLFGVLLASGSEAQNIQSVHDATINMDLRNATLMECFSEIEKQTDFKFSFDHYLIDPQVKINYKSRNKTVSDLLLQISKSANLKFKQINNNINVQKVNGQANDQIVPVEVIIQGRTVTGRILSGEDNSGLPGVNVIVKGTSQGTVTDIEGAYSVNVPNDNAILVFSSVGFVSQEVTVGNQSVIDLTLQPDVTSLEEIVVIGYGSVKKSDLTGSVASVKAEELQETPITSIDQGLLGRAAGVQVTQTSGMPGAVASIRIRGTSSLQGGNEPLYVIDGFPIYNGSGYGNTGGNARMSGLATINPADIESIEVLKDASATAIYGARAANGVVLITTKSGKQGRDVITFDAYYGTQSVVQQIDVMNALNYAELVNEAYTNDGLAPVYDNAKMDELRANPEGTDWQDEVFRTAPIQNYQLAFSGGDEKMTYSVSGNYFDQQGVLINSYFRRFSGRVNLTRNINDKFSFGTSINISRTNSNAVRTDAGGNQGVVSAAMKFNPVQPVYQNEELGEYTQVNSPGIIYANPVATAKEQVRGNTMVRLLGNIFGEWEFLPNLKAKVLLGTDLVNTKFDTFVPSNIFESGGVANATITGGYTTNWLNENTLSWSKQINENHFVSVLGGVTFQGNNYQSMSASSQDYVNNVLEENSLQAGSIYNQPTSSNTDWSLISYLGRVNYNIMEKYLISFNARVDGSSRFGSNNKYAFFPSGAVAWRVIEENFMDNVNALSNLKLRVSYGVTGNQEIGLYNSLPTLTSTTYTIGRSLTTGFFPNKIPNPDLQWEKTAQFDVGIDLGFWDERLRITSDYYSKKTTDLIYNVAVPYVSGFSTSLQNIGSVLNEGIELAIESDIISSNDFRWTAGFNVSFNRNEVLELGGEEYKDVGAGDGHLKTGSVHRLIVGEPIGLFYGYVFDGIFQNQAELDAGPKSPTNWIGGRRYADLGGPNDELDGIVNATYDRTVIGDPNPDFFGGFTNNLYYKGFELNLFFQFNYGNDIFNYNAMELELPSGGQNVYSDLVNRWTPENPSDIYPVATTNRSAVFSDAYIEDGSYLKVKTLTFAYTFPGLTSGALQDLKLYFTAQNLLTFTGYTGYDPEVSYRGATNLELGEDFGGYPQSRTYMLGVKMNIR